MMLRQLMLLVILLLIGFSDANAQALTEVTQSQLDSSQRLLMKDSLQMSDVQIDSVFAIRNRYWEAVASVRSDSTISMTQQQALYLTFKEDAYAAMRLALGTEIFNRYIQLIVQRANRRQNRYNAPLTGVQ